MARCLIIGCGCRGQLLTRRLRAQGHVVRGTTRSADRVAAIEAAGAQAHVGDPDRLATMTPAYAHVSLAYVLLGSATGAPEAVEALHGVRLESLLWKMLDTTVHAIVYESVGSVDPALLAAGSEKVRSLCEGSRIPYALLDADPGEPERWMNAAARLPDAVLT